MASLEGFIFDPLREAKSVESLAIVCMSGYVSYFAEQKSRRVFETAPLEGLIFDPLREAKSGESLATVCMSGNVSHFAS